MMINLIDIGCGHHLSKPWKNNIENIDNFLGFDYFELSPKKGNINLCAGEVFLFKKLVFDIDGVTTFHICSDSWVSSIFNPNIKITKKYFKDKFIVKNIKKVECIRLDTSIKMVNTEFDFIKLDAQGAEFNALNSMGKYLERDIVGVDVKMFFKEVYKGIVLYSDTHKFLTDKGFKQVKRIHKNDEVISDFLYIRKDNYKKDKKAEIKRIYSV
jgi:FkbM family methyltransferase